MLQNIVNFLFEAGLLNDTPRSGFSFLGTIQQSVAEHAFRTTLIGYCLAKLVPQADETKLIKMCLVHDLLESRVGDLNYMQKKYVQANESKAIEEQARLLPFGEEYKALLEEWDKGETLEAQLARDADQLELLLMLRRALDLGNQEATHWMKFALQRLKTSIGQELGQKIVDTPSDEWWFDKSDSWWIHAQSSEKKHTS